MSLEMGADTLKYIKVAGQAIAAIGSITSGIQASNERDRIANNYRQEAELSKKGLALEEKRKARAFIKFQGNQIARAGESGFNVSDFEGIFEDDFTSFKLDLEIGQFNNSIFQLQKLNDANNQERLGSASFKAGFGSAFEHVVKGATILGTGSTAITPTIS